MTAGKASLTRLDWRFGLWWVLANALGWVVGFTICEAVKAILASITYAIGHIGAPDGALIGTGIGLVQWLVLRRYMTRTGWWILATIIGFAFGKALGDVIAGHVVGWLGFVLGGAVIGLWVGVAQWVVLALSKKVYQSEWWILASVVAWAVGWLVINLVDESAGGPIGTIYIIGSLGAALSGAITGATLIWRSRFALLPNEPV